MCGTLVWRFVKLLLAEELYTPDVMEFSGASTIGAEPDPAFSPAAAFTIEFWVAAGWESDPGYDPVVVAYGGLDTQTYSISVLRDRDGIGVLTGETELIAGYDFSDQKLHHVAVVAEDNAIAIVIDGQVRASFNETLLTGASDGLWVGTLDGETAPFIGAIGQMRFWKAALSVEALAAFATADIMSPNSGDHPYLDNISAISDFTAPALLIADSENSKQN